MNDLDFYVDYAWSVFPATLNEEPDENIVGPSDADPNVIDALFDEMHPSNWVEFVAVDMDMYPPPVLLYGRASVTVDPADLLTDMQSLNDNVTHVFLEW